MMKNALLLPIPFLPPIRLSILHKNLQIKGQKWMKKEEEEGSDGAFLELGGGERNGTKWSLIWPPFIGLVNYTPIFFFFGESLHVPIIL
jgi:hypothetical protein